ncbi:hypothetical protein VTN00DRAFT_4513 [Thermoascus crustaceus]|uniref:uncharacterized protein n=1 Tax=Thermoascus crustaceus TaxID=5088 RepID=UPI00374303E0
MCLFFPEERESEKDATQHNVKGNAKRTHFCRPQILTLVSLLSFFALLFGRDNGHGTHGLRMLKPFCKPAVLCLVLYFWGR